MNTAFTLKSAPISTQAELAAVVGVSQVTIHKALTNQSGVSESLRQRIRGLAQEHGYRLNTGAKAVRRQRAGFVTLVMSADPSRSTLPMRMLQGISDELESKAMHLSVAYLRDEQLTDATFVPRILSEWTSDALLLNYHKLVPPRLIELIERYRIPAVWLNDRRPEDCVYPDDLAAGADATRHLIERGHRRIAYISFSYKTELPHYSEIDRRGGYERAMRDAGLEPLVLDRYRVGERVQARPMVYGERTEACAALLSRAIRPTGIVAYSENVAPHLLPPARQLGIEVPRDLSVITFGSGAGFFGQDADTLLVPDDAVGRTGVEMILSKLNEPRRACPARAIEFTFVGGTTLAPPPPTGVE